MTIASVAKQLQMPELSIRRSVEAARKAHGIKLFRIAGWEVIPRHKIPRYDIQRGMIKGDIKKPPAASGAERQRRYKDKHAGRIRIARRTKAGITATPWSGL